MENFNNKKINELIKEVNNDLEEAEIIKLDAKNFIDYITNEIYKELDANIIFCIHHKRELINNLKSVLIDNETHKMGELVYHINKCADFINYIGHNAEELYSLIPEYIYNYLKIDKRELNNTLIDNLNYFIDECGIYGISKEEIIKYFNNKDHTNKFLKQLKEYFNYE